MKKCVAIILGIVMILSLTVQVAAAPDRPSFGDVKYVDEGHIKIDGVKDEAAWANALVIPTNKRDDDGAVAREPKNTVASLLWNEKGLYVFFEIDDPTFTVTPNDFWSAKGEAYWFTDAVFVVIDQVNEQNEDTGQIVGDLVQYVFMSSGLGLVCDQSRGDLGWPNNLFYSIENAAAGWEAGETDEYMEFATRRDGNKFFVEILIYPRADLLGKANFGAGDFIGIHLQGCDRTVENPNDDDEGMIWTRANSWPGDMDGWDGHHYDNIMLVAESAVPAAPAPAEDVPDSAGDVPDAPAAPVDDAPAAAPSAPKVGNTSMIVFVSMIALSAAVLVSRKKIKR